MPFDSEIGVVDLQKLILQKAADKIQAGWVKQVFVSGHSYCAVGALSSSFRAVYGFYPGRAKRKTGNDRDGDLAPFFRALGFNEQTQVMAWNDSHRTTKEHVLDRFGAALRRTP